VRHIENPFFALLQSISAQLRIQFDRPVADFVKRRGGRAGSANPLGDAHFGGERREMGKREGKGRGRERKGMGGTGPHNANIRPKMTA